MHLPEAFHVVEIEQSIAAENGNIKILSLGDNQAIEGIAVMKRQQTSATCLRNSNWEFGKSVLCEKPWEIERE